MSQAHTTDILIIGGGVIGLSIARQLHKSGVRDITVIDKGTCGREASWAAAGMLSPQAETNELDEFFEFCSRSRAMYPQFAAELLRETDVDIELERTGTIYLELKDDAPGELLARYRLQRDAALEVELLSDEEVVRLEPHTSASVSFGVLFPNDWQVDNRRLVQALRAYADRNGINVIENTPVQHELVETSRVTGAETSRGTIHSQHTVLTAGAWSSLIALGDFDLPARVEPVKGQIVCLTAPPGTLAHVIYSHQGYLVPRRDGRILAGSTTEHTGYDDSASSEAIERLTRFANEMLPATLLETTDSWAGLRPRSTDGLPILGGIHGLTGLTIATGHYRNGILLTPITAELIADRIVNGVHQKELAAFGLERFSSVAGASN